jgi:hypothetical protein
MKHRALIVGAGRIGAGYNWHDDAYTHAGAYRALADRVELAGFVEPDKDREECAEVKWGLPAFTYLGAALERLTPDIVSICTQPQDQYAAIAQCIKAGVKYIWCEKPYEGPRGWPGVSIQVNYMRRGDWQHQLMAQEERGGRLIVYGKDDIHTRCHFEDLAKWWDAELDYRPLTGPCSYTYLVNRHRSLFYEHSFTFDNGGVDGGTCFKAMLGNLLDHMDNGTELWSPAQ